MLQSSESKIHDTSELPGDTRSRESALIAEEHEAPTIELTPIRLAETRDQEQHRAESYISELITLEESLESEELIRAQLQVVIRAMQHLRNMEMAKFAEFVYNNHGGPLQDRLYTFWGTNLMEGSPGQEREDVMAWAFNLENSELKNDVFFYVGRCIFQSDEEVSSLLSRLNAEAATSLLRGYALKISHSDPEKAVETYIRLSAEGADLNRLRDLIFSLNRDTNFKAVDALLPDDTRHIARDMRSTLLRNWARSAPQEAVEHILANPDHISIDQLNVALAVWAHNDLTQSSDWVRNQNDPAIRSQAFYGMASHLKNRSPDRAWEWALEIDDPDMRARTLREVHASWITQDYEAAESARLLLNE